MPRGKSDGGYRLPQELIDHELLCLKVPVPNNREYKAALWGALTELTKWWVWEKDDRRGGTIAAQYWRELLLGLEIGETSCDVDLAPYWDDADANNADGVGAIDTGAPWYEDAADWVISAFISTTFSPAAALAYTSIVPKARLLFRTRDYGAIVSVVVDGIADEYLVDTYSLAPGIIALDIESPASGGGGGALGGFSAQSMPAMRFTITHTGLANPAAVVTPRGFAVEVIRKRIYTEESEIDLTDIRVSATGALEKFSNGVWTPLSGWRLISDVVPEISGARDGNVALTSTLFKLAQVGLIDNNTTVGTRPVDGTQGPSGATGTQGPSGATGATGAPGPSGATGAPGPSGATGAPGPSGQAGVSATSGANGDAKRCGVATYLTDVILPDLVNGLLNNLDNGANAAQIAIGSFGLGAAVFSAGVSAIAASGVVLFLELVNIDTALVRAEITNSFYEIVRCAIYESLANDGLLTQSVTTSAANLIDARASSLNARATINPILRALSDEARNEIAVIGALTAGGNCNACVQNNTPPLCTSFSVTFDTTASWLRVGADVVHGAPGQPKTGFLSASGGRGSPFCVSSAATPLFFSGQTLHMAQVEIDLGIACNIASVSYFRRTTGFVGGAGFTAGFYFFDANGTLITSNQNDFGLSQAWEQRTFGVVSAVRYITIMSACFAAQAPIFIDDIQVNMA